jgi:mannan endo-1,4-beta-mannosidase
MFLLTHLKMKLICVITVVLLSIAQNEARLSVKGHDIMYNGQKVFLSGANIAWFNYARDFGSGAYSGVKSKYESAIDEIAKSGGNAIRVWVHIDGTWSPKFDGSGHATGADTDSLITEIGELLDHAGKQNVFVILCLWNLAVKPQQMVQLYTDDAKLDSYLEKVLKPMAKAFANKPALGAWEIINEPIGGTEFETHDSNPCFDSSPLKGTGANWAGVNLKLKDILKFVNHHAAAIKSVDPKALVTVGESGEHSMTTICSTCHNYYSDHCLTAAGGKSNGVLDFYQLHSYTWQGKFSDTSPFHKKASDFNADKPILMGEFATVCSESKDAVKNYQYLYDNGYVGALSWQYNEGGDCADKRSSSDSGMASIKDMTSHGSIRIKM